MIKNYSYPGWTKRAALSAVALCVAATAAHAQTITGYATNFDGAETNNGVNSTTTYVATPNATTSPLSGQNGWGSNDATQTGTQGTSTQLVGKSDFLLTSGFFTGNNGLLGGVYRTTAPTAASPDVVPSTASGGVVSLFHTVSGGGNTSLALNVDFSVVNSANFAAHDTFGFSLRSTAGTLVTINFAPSTTNTTADTVTGTSGGTTVASTSGVTFNSTYHLALSVNLASKTYLATISTVGGTASSFSLTGSTANAAITGTAVTQFATLWNLQDKTATGTAYNAAGDGYIIFDNLSVTVPEPSTYAMLALGVVGLGVLLRRKVA